MISCIIMIVAQSSWYVLVVVMNSLEDSVYSNYLWTVFNCLIMILIILINKVNTENVPTESVTPRHQNS
jgi:4-amino-4-deoxy-L-arabinose transferase-like glycosyltransferase